MVISACVKKLWPFWHSTLVENQNFWSKPLITKCAIKSRVLIHFHSNFDTILEMLIERCLKNKIS